jgi:hypothetical protein
MQREETGAAQQATPKPEKSSPYLRFGAMIATSTVVMHLLTYANTYSFDHVRVSQERIYMSALMGAAMAIIMLLFMWGMHRDTKINFMIIGISLAVAGASWTLARNQATVDDTAYMKAMIPHHSIAILTSENSNLDDQRVCELAVAIIEAQRKEISEMDWLIADIAANGPASTPEEALSRPVPTMEGSSSRTCLP